MINKTSTKLLILMTVLIPYLVLVGYSISVFPDLPDELESGFPRIMVFLPAFIATMLPATYGIMIFFFGHYLKKAHLFTIAAFMDLGMIGLIGAVYMIKDSST